MTLKTYLRIYKRVTIPFLISMFGIIGLINCIEVFKKNPIPIVILGLMTLVMPIWFKIKHDMEGFSTVLQIELNRGKYFAKEDKYFSGFVTEDFDDEFIQGKMKEICDYIRENKDIDKFVEWR